MLLYYFEGQDWQGLREDLLFGYYNDFKRIYGESHLEYYQAGLSATADLLGSPFKNTIVAERTQGGKSKEIVEALSQLEAWKLIYKAPQKGPNPGTHFHPKRYLFDGGIAKALRESAMPGFGLGANASTKRSSVGGLFENLVAATLYRGPTQQLVGWKKSSSGSEVDFIINHQSKSLPVECKLSQKIKKTHLSGIKDYMEIYECDLGMVVSLAPLEYLEIGKGKRILNLPIYALEYWEGFLDISLD